jgi:hypothetical protein
MGNTIKSKVIEYVNSTETDDGKLKHNYVFKFHTMDDDGTLDNLTTDKYMGIPINEDYIHLISEHFKSEMVKTVLNLDLDKDEDLVIWSNFLNPERNLTLEELKNTPSLDELK